MLGAVRMREPRASMRIMGWRLHMKLRAFCCPPARDISLRIAHLHAAASQVRFRTMAVAPACRYTPQQCGCVRKERQRAGQENDSLEVECEQGRPPRDGLVDEAAHESILRKERGKTDSPGVRKLCYQGPGTKWQQCARKRWSETVPDSDLRQFRIELGVRIWREWESSPQS
jgi:hypothetical protein